MRESVSISLSDVIHLINKHIQNDGGDSRDISDLVTLIINDEFFGGGNKAPSFDNINNAVNMLQYFDGIGHETKIDVDSSSFINLIPKPEDYNNGTHVSSSAMLRIISTKIVEGINRYIDDVIYPWYISEFLIPTGGDSTNLHGADRFRELLMEKSTRDSLRKICLSDSRTSRALDFYSAVETRVKTYLDNVHGTGEVHPSMENMIDTIDGYYCDHSEDGKISLKENVSIYELLLMEPFLKNAALLRSDSIDPTSKERRVNTVLRACDMYMGLNNAVHIIEKASAAVCINETVDDGVTGFVRNIMPVENLEIEDELLDEIDDNSQTEEIDDSHEQYDEVYKKRNAIKWVNRSDIIHKIITTSNAHLGNYHNYIRETEDYSRDIDSFGYYIPCVFVGDEIPHEHLYWRSRWNAPSKETIEYLKYDGLDMDYAPDNLSGYWTKLKLNFDDCEPLHAMPKFVAVSDTQKYRIHRLTESVRLTFEKAKSESTSSSLQVIEETHRILFGIGPHKPVGSHWVNKIDEPDKSGEIKLVLNTVHELLERTGTTELSKVEGYYSDKMHSDKRLMDMMDNIVSYPIISHENADLPSEPMYPLILDDQNI